MTKIIRPLRNGQITIPADFREKLGIDADTLLQVRVIHKELWIKPVKAYTTVGGSLWVKELYNAFSPVRKEAEEKGYTEEIINSAIDRSVRKVRLKHDKSSL